MDVVELTPTREQLVYTFGGVAPIMRITPGTALRLWSEDTFGGVLRSVDDLSAAKVDLRFVNPQTGPLIGPDGATIGQLAAGTPGLLLAYSAAGDRSAPLGHTIVPASSSTRTAVNSW